MAGKPPSPRATLTLSPTQGSTGTSVTATGANFDKKATATLTFGTTNVGSAATSASGGFTKSFVVPSGYSGATTVTAKTATKTANASFNVTSSAPPPADTTAPNAPSNLWANPGDGQVSLSWGASTDNVGVTGYRIFRNGTQVAAVGGSTLSYTDTGLVNGTTYSYTVRAVDAAGNVSSDSSTATATPQASPDIMAPAAPTGLTATAGDAQVSLDWADGSESDLDHYNVYRDGTQVASPTASNYTDSGLTNGTSYSYQVTAVDHAGNESAKSSGVSTTPQAAPDTTAPAAPTGLTTTAGDAQVSLDWADGSESDLDHYNVYRDGTQVASPTASNYTDSGLTNGTSYSYQVTAVDHAGNESAKSSSVSTTPQAAPDTTAPAAPAGLTATAGDAQVSLDWADSSESDLDHYNLYRGTTKIASPTSSAYTDTGLTNGSEYTYQATAVDSSGNESAKSASASATPQASNTGDLVVTAAGDICGSTTNCHPTAVLSQSINPTRELTLGDNAYPDGTLSQFNTYYDPNWGVFKANTHPATGNHDYRTSGAQGYFDYFGAVAAPGPYYSYDVGSWHFIALGSSAGVSNSAGGAEETWLKNDLAAHSNQCTLAYWHEPRWSSGTVHGSNSSWNAIWNDLYNANVDVVLNGHEHNYERFAPQNPNGQSDPTRGIVEVVAGTGGEGGSYPFGTPLANSVARAGPNVFGLVKITLHSSGYDLDFVPVQGQTFTDHYSGTCH
jgi:fibronectin type 3 domain-containing protein